MPTILEQLGVSIPQLPETGLGGLTEEGTRTGAMPVAEAQTPVAMNNLREIFITILAGMIVAIEKMLPEFGVASEEGKILLDVVKKLEKIVPPDKITEAQSLLNKDISGMMAQMPQAMPQQPTQATGQATPPTGGMGGSLPPELEALIKGGK